MRIANQRRISHIDDPVVHGQSSARTSTTTTGEEVLDKVSLSEAARAKSHAEEEKERDEDEDLEPSPFPEPREFATYTSHGYPSKFTG
jgi:hypothetical protein